MRAGHKNSVWLRVSRDDAWTKQSCKCAYCLSRMSRADATTDHIKPRSKGGVDHHTNIAASCVFCNSAKGNINPSLFKRMINGGKPPPNINVRIVKAVRALNKQTELACKRIFAQVGMKPINE